MTNMIASSSFRNSSRIAYTLCMMLALGAISGRAWAQAGYIHELSGTASIERASGKAPAKVGDKFESNSTFQTGAGAKLVLKFADGQLVALSPDAALRVGYYRYVSNNPRQSTSTIELITGEMRLVTGVIGSDNRDGVRIIAGESTLSLLKSGGADFIVRVKPQPQEVGAAIVTVGEIGVRTPYGPITRVEAGQYAPWQPGRLPPLPVRLASAPASVQASVASLLTLVLPANRPAEIDSAARTAIGVAADRRAATAARGDAPARAEAASSQVRAGGPGGGPIGYVHETSGEVSMQKPSSATARPKVGDAFDPNTTFATGFDGKVTLKFADGQIVVLGLDSKLRVGEYSFDTNRIAQSNSEIALAQGAMRLVTGIIGADNRRGLQITAGETTVSIVKQGGADFTVVVDTLREEVGAATVAAGDISLRTPYYPITRISAGQFAPWQPGRVVPLPAPLSAAPAVIQAAAAPLLETPLPSNTPTPVAVAARAVVAAVEAKQAQAAASASPQNAQLQAIAAAAAEQAATATKAATAAAEAVSSAVFEKALVALPATAAGPTTATQTLPPVSIQTVLGPPKPTPGGGGGCIGSPC